MLACPPWTPTETERKVFEVLVREHHRRLLAFTLALLEDSSVADDLVQNALVTAYLKFGEFDPNRDFGAWIRGIIRMKHREWMRSRREILVDDEILEVIEQQHQAWDAAVRDGRGEVLEALDDCLQRLDEAPRRVVGMFYFDKQPSGAIALALAINEATVWKRLQRARESLADCIESKIGRLSLNGSKR